MSLDIDRLKNSIIDKFVAKGMKKTEANEFFAEVIAQSVVEEIKKAVVSVTVSGGSSGGNHSGIIT